MAPGPRHGSWRFSALTQQRPAPWVGNRRSVGRSSSMMHRVASGGDRGTFTISFKEVQNTSGAMTVTRRGILQGFRPIEMMSRYLLTVNRPPSPQ
jgi:hypothetical protein